MAAQSSSQAALNKTPRELLDEISFQAIHAYWRDRCSSTSATNELQNLLFREEDAEYNPLVPAGGCKELYQPIIQQMFHATVIQLQEQDFYNHDKSARQPDGMFRYMRHVELQLKLPEVCITLPAGDARDSLARILNMIKTIAQNAKRLQNIYVDMEHDFTHFRFNSTTLNSVIRAMESHDFSRWMPSLQEATVSIVSELRALGVKKTYVSYSPQHFGGRTIPSRHILDSALPLDQLAEMSKKQNFISARERDAEELATKMMERMMHDHVVFCL